MSQDKDSKFEGLLTYLKATRGFDFAAYKRTSLRRRVEKRMLEVTMTAFEDYIDYLEVHPEEFEQLFNTILINVTSFFRDDATWEFLNREVVPQIRASKQPGDPIRVWSAGCASGEEAYSVAMVLAESLGPDAYSRQVKIYASDVDEDALAKARAAAYTRPQIESVPVALRDKYFTLAADRYIVRNELRRQVIFGRHDLVQDAPISRVDLLVCRNTLMYLNGEAQRRIVARFHFAINDSGYLFLGRAETLLTHTSLFNPLDLKHRIFAKVPRPVLRDQLLVMAQAGNADAANHLGRHVRMREAAFDGGQVAQLVVDLNSTVVLINERCRTIFGLEPKDVGRPLQDLQLSYRPIELRSLIEKARAERRPVRINAVEWQGSDGATQYFDVEVSLLLHNGETPFGVLVALHDVTRSHLLQTDLQLVNQNLETANEELQSAHEELETTNEELQSTNEELETTNEELQSTNEELETMNEELQSTNEELETLNTELRERSEEVDKSNLFLHSILSSLHAGVAVVDRQNKVLIWNDRATDLWGLREDEVVGRSILDLDIGLPVRELETPLLDAIAGRKGYCELVLDALSRRGKSIQCLVTCNPLLKNDGNEVPGVVLFMTDSEIVEKISEEVAEPKRGKSRKN